MSEDFEINITPETQDAWERFYLSLTGDYDNATWMGWCDDKQGKYIDIKCVDGKKKDILYFNIEKLKEDFTTFDENITELSIPLYLANQFAHECGKLGLEAFSYILNMLIENWKKEQ